MLARLVSDDGGITNIIGLESATTMKSVERLGV